LNLDYVLALNAIAYTSAGAGALQLRKQRQTKPVDSLAAFQLFEVSLRRAFPDLKEGFTWREAVSRTRGLTTDLDWVKIGGDLDLYEAYRYGGDPLPPMPGIEFFRLLKALRRLG
jgi:hypothetical protein